MNRAKRLTRRESQQATRQRLVGAAERAFIRRGFDASSVEQIAEEAGFSRGAFYSNFRSKDELFMEVLRTKRKRIDRALEEIVAREKDPGRRLRAVLDWYVKQDLDRGWIILETESTLRAMRNRAARERIAALNRQRAAEYAALAERHFAESAVDPPARPEAVATALFAAARGLAELALVETGREREGLYAECRDLLFQQLVPAAGKDKRRRQ
ncbi:MAG: TetR/AcrR family transcriptional regulator [Bryobacteraceae bacterium]